ncbi:formylglycine-generating enzyme family protein [Sorangium sp. So ce394]|uniref:formylglycine-generating enzyme family protein n=1 Tax=Sorangium sp. So ce394 TaxID=3133310 RepID=UPI003F5BCE42
MPTRTPAAALILLVAAGVAGGAGCDRAEQQQQQQAGEKRADGGAPAAPAPSGKVLEAAENESPAASARPQAGAVPAGPARVEIPAGKLVAGSTPGDKGRDPALEPALLDVELGGFTIDRYLYPNDPAQPPLTGVTRARASELCEQAGGRLCTELEWERACKGPEGTPYAGGAAWDPACAKAPASCASGFGVLGMGAAVREWTASDVAPIENLQPKAAAVRGATASASGVDHRCARRAAVDPGASGDDIGFRCCHGAPNAASVPSPQWQQTYRRAEIGPQQVAELLASVPQLRDLGGEVKFFKEPDDVNVVLSRGRTRLSPSGTPAIQPEASPPPNTTLTTSPLLWNPVPGEEVLVVTGKSDEDSFIVAFLKLPGDRYRIASSLLLKGDPGPIALGFNGYVRRRLTWATCWDCRGESGNVTYRDDNRVVITQK